MDLFQILILACVQAFTEWLPVSSSGHLAIIQNLFNIKDAISFDVFLHLASVLALIVFLRRDIIEIIRKRNFRLILFIVLASIPAAIFGFLVKDYVEQAFSSLMFIAFGLIITSIALFSTKFINKDEKLTWKRSLFIGLFQAIAIFPGISRSGFTLFGGLLAGLNREKAFKFSLLMAIPVILGASLLKFSNFVFDINFIMGFLICSLLSYLALTVFSKIVIKNRIYYLGYYCMLLALLILALLFIKS
jgi:undecaprenyl-diphosphatase